MGYNRENYEQVKAEIESRRRKATEEAEGRRARLHSRSPEAAEIDSALARHSLRLFEIACTEEGEEKSRRMAELRAENEALQQTRRTLLSHLGLPQDETDPRYSCPICKDTGAVGMKMCECMRKELTLLGIRTSGIGNLAQRQSFENFKLDYYEKGDEREQMKVNFDTAKHYAETFSEASPNLLMIGFTGLGKTHLSTAIAREVIERGYDVLYDSAQNIIADYEADQFHSDRTVTKKRSEKYLLCDLLIIDDLGTEFQNNFSLSCLYNLLNTRVNRGMPTVVNTNLTAGQLRTRYDDRIASRLLGEFRLLIFNGADIRQQKL